MTEALSALRAQIAETSRAMYPRGDIVILEHSARSSYSAQTWVPGAWVAPLDGRARAELDAQMGMRS